MGCTPFLAAVLVDRDPGDPVPTMLYAVRSAENNPMVDRLRAAEQQGRLDLPLFTTATGRMTPADLDRLFPESMSGHHVALCGPASLVSSMAAAASSRGAVHIESEDFDIRQGFGPDRSAEIDSTVRRRFGRSVPV